LCEIKKKKAQAHGGAASALEQGHQF
jgi:hypothetical protein